MVLSLFALLPQAVTQCNRPSPRILEESGAVIVASYQMSQGKRATDLSPYQVVLTRRTRKGSTRLVVDRAQYKPHLVVIRTGQQYILFVRDGRNIRGYAVSPQFAQSKPLRMPLMDKDSYIVSFTKSEVTFAWQREADNWVSFLTFDGKYRSQRVYDEQIDGIRTGQ